METKIRFNAVLFDNDDNLIDNYENTLKIESESEVNSAKKYFKLIENNSDDINDNIKEYVKNLNSENYQKAKYILVNFFTERWDYIIATEINFL